MAKQIIYKHYQRILTQWPVDRLRPNVSFQEFIQKRVDARLKPKETLADNVVANEAQATIPAPPKFDEKSELEQVNALYSFLENRYTKKYPLSDKMMKPASNPEYYETLVKELDAAPDRSRWTAFVNRWKGFIRWN